MEVNRIKSFVLNYLDENLGYKEPVKPQLSLKKDIGMDSLERTEMCITFEKEFSVSVPDATFDKWVTVQNVIDTFEQLVYA